MFSFLNKASIKIFLSLSVAVIFFVAFSTSVHACSLPYPGYVPYEKPNQENKAVGIFFKTEYDTTYTNLNKYFQVFRAFKPEIITNCPPDSVSFYPTYFVQRSLLTFIVSLIELVIIAALIVRKYRFKQIK